MAMAKNLETVQSPSFKLEAYLTNGVENIVKEAIRAT